MPRFAHPRFALNAACLILALVALAGCSPLDALDLAVPREGYVRQEGIAYGTGARHRLDVYVPEAGEAPLPVIVFIYGGSWTSGSRDQYRFVGQALAERGYVVVVPDYRLDPEGRFPGFVEDSAAALAWTVREVARFRGDPKRVFLMGHSAGAYNAAMVAADPRFLAALGLDRGAVAGFIGLAGPYDFLPFDNATTRRIFGHALDPAATQPIRAADGATPPALLLHGIEDDTVYPRNSRRFADRLRALGVDAELQLYPDTGHVGILLALSPLRRNQPSVLTDLDRFTRRVGSTRLAARQ